jgi:phosphopantothenoylcysteine decarboxylase/phosphopantothenate--cysteine ligase
MVFTATRFVGAATFEAITRRRVITDQFEAGMNADIEHIALASTIDLLLIAPATANIIGKLANGIADDFLSTLYTATRAPVLIAPAMNSQMFAHEAIRKNMDLLAARGAQFVEPGDGYLACGWIGKGRLAEPERSWQRRSHFRPEGCCGQRVLVTAGPTFEDFDPVSSATGRAAELRRCGGGRPSRRRRDAHHGPPASKRRRSAKWCVRNAAEMHQAVMSCASEMRVVVRPRLSRTTRRIVRRRRCPRGETLTRPPSDSTSSASSVTGDSRPVSPVSSALRLKRRTS